MDNQTNRNSAVDSLAAFASGVHAESLPADTLQIAKACLLYSLAVAIAAKKAKPALIAAAACEQSSPTATRLLDGVRMAPGMAAFANAVLMSARAQGDSHLCGHLGGVVIPAALAAGEQREASGSALMSAIVAGYEVALRIGRDHYADLSARGFRTSPSYGVIGAAVACARVRGHNAQQTATAICLAPNFAGGLREYVDAGTEESPFQAGFAARNGLYVSDLVANGAEAAPSALTGGAGFYRAFGKKGVDYARRLTAGLGADFEFTNVTYKEYPACQIVRGFVPGLTLIREKAANVAPERIELRFTPYEANFIGTAYKGPFTSAAQTLMSAPFCAALAWETGTVGYGGLRDFNNEKLLALVEKIHVVADDTRKKYEPAISVSLSDGRRELWEATAGDSSYRLTWDAAVRMNEMLCDEVSVPRRVALDLAERVAEIEKLRTIAPLVSAVCGATTSNRATA